MPNASLQKFSRELVEIMPVIYKEFARREDNELTKGKISCPQMVTLDYVLRRARVNMKDIARHLGVQMSSATTLVDRLIRQKMLMRHRDEEDRRLVRVTITPKGRKVVEQILNQKRRSIRGVFSVLTDSERGHYLKILRKVYSHHLD